MKIKETIERECCAKSDLKRYNGILLDPLSTRKYFYFCIHCGQIWREVSVMDGAGSSNLEFTKVTLDA